MVTKWQLTQAEMPKATSSLIVGAQELLQQLLLTHKEGMLIEQE